MSSKKSFQMKECGFCKKNFVPSRRHKKYCSTECSLRSQRLNLPVRICEHCGKKFVPKQRRSRFCSTECNHLDFNKRNPEIMRRNSAKWRKENPEKYKESVRRYHLKEKTSPRKSKRQYYARDAKFKKICPACGSEFTTNILHKKYCSKECYVSATRESYIEYMRSYWKSDEYKDKRRKYYYSEKQKAYRASKEYRILQRMNQVSRAIREDELYRQDAEAYAKYRARRRKYKKAKAVKNGKWYHPIPSRRVPDHLRKGEDGFDRDSVFAVTSFEKNAYGRELAIERNQMMFN